MPPIARTPQEAVAFLDELGPDVKACVVLDRDGGLLAQSGPDEPRGREMGDLALELFQRADSCSTAEVGGIEVATSAGTLFAARRGAFAIAVVASRLALSSLVMFDLRRILGDLETAAA